ncbi:glutathione S-transferase family protein [Nitrosomonas ureae]|uniref:Putative glutathione S-transferase n=1 Tax=Nitrosomonas ureae TaxID=44577 RepID=A0A1H2HLW1_9PROT|nr:glutathione S-transferase family protein [Nitrosomonas ureae]SDU32766.1 putative glutathione S-transferase [Nitrosomonas ureae]
MGLLVDGKWQDKWYDTDSTDGEFVREDSRIRNWIGTEYTIPHNAIRFPARKDRYHLYVSYACPWAHRTLIVRMQKQLEKIVSISAVSPIMLEHGWTFNKSEGSTGDSLYGYEYLHQLYNRHDDEYTGRVTVPVLWDKQTEQIVNNESADIIRIFNCGFDEFTNSRVDLYPEVLRETIDEINERIYTTVNNGVYRAGFATTQRAYECAFVKLFDTLDWLEESLSTQRFLTGNRLTEADWRLFTTLIRFDTVYYSHFKTNRRRIEDYPHLSNYLRDLYQIDFVASTTNLLHIKQHYYFSHKTINPTQIIPLGPDIDYDKPHNREKFA